MALNNLGLVVLYQGDHDRAAELCQESLTLARELGDKKSIAAALTNLGDVARDRGDSARAAGLRVIPDKLYLIRLDKAFPQLHTV